MGDHPGHLMSRAYGRKLESLAEMPEDYLRAGTPVDASEVDRWPAAICSREVQRSQVVTRPEATEIKVNETKRLLLELVQTRPGRLIAPLLNPRDLEKLLLKPNMSWRSSRCEITAARGELSWSRLMCAGLTAKHWRVSLGSGGPLAGLSNCTMKFKELVDRSECASRSS